MPKSISTSLHIQGLSTGTYIVSGVINKVTENDRVRFVPGDKEFRKHKDAAKNRADAKAFAKKIQEEILETLE